MGTLTDILNQIKRLLPLADLLSGNLGSGYAGAQFEQFRRSVAKAGFGANLPPKDADLLKFLRAVSTAARDTLTHGDRG